MQRRSVSYEIRRGGNMTYTDLPLIRLVARSIVSHRHHLCLSHLDSINALAVDSIPRVGHVCGKGIYVRPPLWNTEVHPPSVPCVEGLA